MNRLVFIITTILMAGMSAQAVAGDPAAGQVKAQACVACHGADGNSANSGFPSLAGQVSGYISGQLAAFKSGKRANAIMMGLAQPLSAKDMADIDAWYSSQVSGDKDLAQLVDSKGRMCDSMKDVVYDVEGVEAKFGVPPERIVDFLALVGDTSDNIPGVLGAVVYNRKMTLRPVICGLCGPIRGCCKRPRAWFPSKPESCHRRYGICDGGPLGP